MTNDTNSDLGGAYSEAIGRAIETKAEESQQLQEETFSKTRGGAISPTFSPTRLAKLLEFNTTHAKAVFAKARNTAGYGLEIVPHPEVEGPEESQRDVADEFWFAGESDWQVGPLESEQATPSDVLEMAWADYEAIGWLAIEALVSRDGTPTGLAYIPAPTIRKRDDSPGFVQERDGKLRYFGSFGDRYGDDRVFVDAESGESGSSVDGTVANEIIWKRNHTPFVDHYGTPDVIPAIPNIMGDKEARSFNIEFFENSAVPKLAITVEGGRLTEESRESIRELFHGKLKDENHRTAILEVEELVDTKPGDFGLEEGANVSVDIEPLTVGLDEDASFLEYHDWNEHELLKAHEVPPIEAGRIESGAFSTDAQAQRKSFVETTIRPKQDAFAELLYETVHEALGVTDYTIRFQTRGVDTSLTDAEVARTRIQASMGMMTVNEARAELDLEPIDGPVGEMLLTEVRGMGGGPAPGGGVGAAVEELVADRVEDAVGDLRDDLVTEGRVSRPISAED